MRKRNNLSARLDEATVSRAPMAWDPKIARAVVERRQQHLASRSTDGAAGDTERIQARLAEARARQEAEIETTD